MDSSHHALLRQSWNNQRSPEMEPVPYKEMNWTRICYPDGHLDLRSLRFVSPLRPALLGQFGKFLPGFCAPRAATTRFLPRSVLFPLAFLLAIVPLFWR